MTERGLTIIYDGQCPFCSSYVSLLRLRDSVGRVELVDARSDDPRVAGVAAAGLDLDAGMVVLWGGRRFHGREAVHLLATLSAAGGIFNSLQRRMFGAPRRAALIYPMLAAGRRLFLRLTGRPTIAEGARAAPSAE
jgi:predicted DCC family thiol-disulfide oxidoreductase YuxK